MAQKENPEMMQDHSNQPVRRSERINKGRMSSFLLKNFEIGDTSFQPQHSSTTLENSLLSQSDDDEIFDGTIKQYPKNTTLVAENIPKEKEMLSVILESMKDMKMDITTAVQENKVQLEHQIEILQRRMVQNESKICQMELENRELRLKDVHRQARETQQQLQSKSTGAVPKAHQQVQEPITPLPVSQFENSISFPWSSRKKLYDLPKFDGSPEDWPKFIASYNESTATYQYSDLENLLRLEKCLSGKALDCVRAMLIHPRGVKDVIQELKFRFGRAELLIASQLNALRRVMPVKENEVFQLIDYSTQVRNTVAFLKNAEVESHLQNPLLLEELVSKLPFSYRYEWAKQLSSLDENANVEDFSKWLSSVARHLSRIEQIENFSNIKNKNTVNKKYAFQTTIDSSMNNENCRFCNDDHKLMNCPKFIELSIPSRWDAVKKANVCFSCLIRGHQVANCRKKKFCGINDCKKMHHELLHESVSKNQQSLPEKRTASNFFITSSQKVPSTILSLNEESQLVYFKMVPVTLFGNNGKMLETFAMFDEGSSVTIIDEDLANELNLKGRTEEMSMVWLNENTSKQRTSVVNCQIQGREKGCPRLQLKNVRTLKHLNLPTQSVDIDQLCKKYPQLEGLPLSSCKAAKPRLLIGLDNCRLCYPKYTVDCPPDGPIACQTILGWCIYGGSSTKSKPNEKYILHISSNLVKQIQERQHELEEIMKNYYETENFGVKLSEHKIDSIENERALQVLKETTTFDGHRYETGLIWKQDSIEMPNSYQMALKRFENLTRKMKRDPVYAEAYVQAMNDFLLKGYAKKLSNTEAETISDHTWYLPHFGVLNPNKPKKIRLVFDAAAVVGNVSLNSQLIKGPDLNQPLMVVLSQFRESAIAVCADIKEMFCQVRIRPQDRDAQRFLWTDDEGKICIYEMQSMIFGASCSPTTAQYVKNHHAEKYVEEFPAAVEAIIHNHYVDDFVKSFQDETTAMKVSKQVKQILSEAGFNLRNFISNSVAVNQAMKVEEDEAETLLNLNVETGVSTEKILGMYWCSESDEFMFKLKFHKVPNEVLEQLRPPTKRELLSVTMSVFDPFGFLANYMIFAKIMFQKTWEENLDWDDQIPVDMAKKWFEWQNELKNVSKIRVPRCYSLSAYVEVELHTFVDASEEAFAAVSYFRINSFDSITVSFVYGKTRVAPRKPLSIPRLELQAAVLGVRLSSAVASSHKISISRRYYWSDSKIVIHWIKSQTRNYKPFVAHRIGEILDESREDEWMWVPTDLNAADKATRPTISKVNEYNSWLKGPDYLYKNQNDWPAQPTNFAQHVVNEELKLVVLLNRVDTCFDDTLIDIKRFGNYQKLIRTTAWVLRFIRNSTSKNRNYPFANGELTTTEFEAGELAIVRQVQKEAFGDELIVMNQRKPIREDSELFRLNPFIDHEGVIRLKGRIDAASILPVTTRRPVILPKKHPVTHLLIAHYHKQCYHQNDETVIGLVRQRFWIPSLRQQLKTVKLNCQICKIRKAKPMQPMMGSLPYDRLTITAPFSYTGVDYFGPVIVTVGRRREKRWVALFTCLTIRAIHLEVATDLSTDSFILCLRNFVNIRGVPIRMRSDNGTNFIGLNKELKNVTDFFDMNEVQKEMTHFGIEWIYNTPTDASAGGCWERLVQSVKRSLQAVFADRSVREDTLRSTLIEIANIVNSRPLTHVPVSAEDEEPLTPNHFLLGRMNSTQTPGPVNPKLMCLRKQWRITQQLKNHFYHRWVTEYLPILTKRSKWFKDTPPLNLGDLVLVCDPSLPRSRWVRGRIEEVQIAKDGQVRSATIRTATGYLKRPANKLAVLDLQVSGPPSDPRGGGCRQPSQPNMT